MASYETQALIIGGGATGTGLARDLALRGVRCILAEQHDINAGASGANHGLLHSGGRYVFTDPHSARECCEEANILRKVAVDCIEDCGGLFVAVEGDDEAYAADFPGLCEKCHIPVKTLDVKEARELEPVLSDKLIAAYMVEDASIDPFKLSLENITEAQDMGTELFCFSKVIGFEKGLGGIHKTHLKNAITGEEFTVKAEQIINASGAWAGVVAELAGIPLTILYSQGSLIITHNRITQRVVNRLRTSSNADILVPGGTVSILGTTSVRIDSLDQIRPTIKEVDAMLDEACAMIPSLEDARYIRAYAGVRPLVSSQSAGSDDRSVSRGFALLDHATDGCDNFTTISGGKLTTYRLMAEKTADLVCRKMGITEPCVTRTRPLPSNRPAKWTEPGLAARVWLKHHESDDILLCECEMVPKSVIDTLITSIREENGHPDLNTIGLRSRVGKGACQGAFCGPRVTSYLYDKALTGAGKDNARFFGIGNWCRLNFQRPCFAACLGLKFEVSEGILGMQCKEKSKRHQIIQTIKRHICAM